MVKKSLVAGLIAIILSLCCGLCFAAEGNNETSTNLGNEITGSVDKAGQSMRNLTDNAFSTNMVNDVRTSTNNMMTDMAEGMNNVDDGIVNESKTNNNNNNNDNNAGNYNTTRTTAETTKKFLINN